MEWNGESEGGEFYFPLSLFSYCIINQLLPSFVELVEDRLQRKQAKDAQKKQPAEVLRNDEE